MSFIPNQENDPQILQRSKDAAGKNLKSRDKEKVMVKILKEEDFASNFEEVDPNKKSIHTLSSVSG